MEKTQNPFEPKRDVNVNKNVNVNEKDLNDQKTSTLWAPATASSLTAVTGWCMTENEIGKEQRQ